MKKVLIIDHYDSFTYTIKHYFESCGADVNMIQFDDNCVQYMDDHQPTHLVFSPGPGHPREATQTLSLIRQYYKRYPILGICLGHQCIMQAFGGRIVAAPEIMHGKVSLISHTGEGLFDGIEGDFKVTRYHSLVVDPSSIPDGFNVTAWVNNHHTGENTVMAFQHQVYPVYGVQFHPESILSENGYRLFSCFLNVRRFDLARD